MGRFSPTVGPTPTRALDFSPLSMALERGDRRRDRDRSNAREDAQLDLNIRAAGGRPVSEVGEERRPTAAPSLATMLPGGGGDPESSYGDPAQSFGDDVNEASDPYNGQSGVGQTELGGGRSPSTRQMVTTSGSALATYLRPYRTSIMGKDYEFDPMQPAKIKAASKSYEDDQEIEHMRALGATDEEIRRSIYPDRSFSLADRTSLKNLDIASRYGIQQMKDDVSKQRLALMDKGLNLRAIANDQRADANTLRAAYIDYLRTNMDVRERIARANAALRDYGIEESSLSNDPIQQMMLPPEELEAIKSRITSARTRAEGATRDLGAGRKTGNGTTIPHKTRPDSTGERPNRYRRGAR